MLWLPYPEENNNGIVKGKQKQCKKYIQWSQISPKSAIRQELLLLQQAREKNLIEEL